MRRLVIGMGLILLSATPSRAGIIKNSIRTVALTGQQAIASQGTVEFSHVLVDFRDLAIYGGQSFQTSFPLINKSGEVAFVATTTRASNESFLQNGVWTEQDGTLRLVTGSGESLPGVNSSISLRFIWGDIVFNDRGEVAFKAITYDRSSDAQKVGSGIWVGTADTLRKVATNIQPLSAVAIENEFLSFSPPSLNNRGQVAFAAQVALPGSGSPFDRLATGIWSDVTGSTQAVVLEGQTINLTTGPGTLGWQATAVFDDAGKVSIFTSISPLIGREFIGYLQASGPQIQPLIMDRQTISTGNQATILIGIEGPNTSNSNGDIVFDAISDRGRILIALDNGSARIVAAQGDLAPGTIDGRAFQGFFGTAASINTVGRVAFRGFLDNTGYQSYVGIWSDASGPLELVVRAGDQAPGADTGQMFLSFATPQLNAVGQIVFPATLAGPGITFENDEGIWAQSALGKLKLIAREGDLLEVAPNDRREIAQLAYGGDFNGTGTSVFNDAGQLVFGALFTDGTSGVFVSNVAAVPEPTSFTLLTLTAFFAYRRRVL